MFLPSFPAWATALIGLTTVIMVAAQEAEEPLAISTFPQTLASCSTLFFSWKGGVPPFTVLYVNTDLMKDSFGNGAGKHRLTQSPPSIQERQFRYPGNSLSGSNLIIVTDDTFNITRDRLNSTNSIRKQYSIPIDTPPCPSTSTGEDSTPITYSRTSSSISTSQGAATTGTSSAAATNGTDSSGNAAATPAASKKTNTPAIAGGVVGGIGALGALGGILAFFLLRRRRRRPATTEDRSDSPFMVDEPKEPELTPFGGPNTTPSGGLLSPPLSHWDASTTSSATFSNDDMLSSGGQSRSMATTSVSNATSSYAGSSTGLVPQTTRSTAQLSEKQRLMANANAAPRPSSSASPQWSASEILPDHAQDAGPANLPPSQLPPLYNPDWHQSSDGRV